MGSKIDKFRGCLVGGAVGDALGYPIEFERGIQERAHTAFNGIGKISDDTQMALFTANALLWRETVTALGKENISPSDALYLAYQDWLETQTQFGEEKHIAWLRDIPELNVSREPGGTCLYALGLHERGTVEQPKNDSKGCGGIMRVAPIGLYYAPAEYVGRKAAEAAAITHGHPLGIIPAYVFAVVVHLLAHNNMQISDALFKALDVYCKDFDCFGVEFREYFLGLVHKAVELSQRKISDTKAIRELGEGWVAEETFAIAVYACLKYADSFADAVVCATNHDGDSDSTGAVAGNMMGAFCGYSQIPRPYRENLELRDLLLEIADDLAAPMPNADNAPSLGPYWLSKYLYGKRDMTLQKAL